MGKSLARNRFQVAFGVYLVASATAFAAPPPKKSPPALPQPTLSQTIKGHHYWMALRFRPDGQRLVAVARNGSVSVIEVTGGKVIATHTPGSNSDELFAVSPDSSRVVLVSKGRVKVFDVDAAKVVADQPVAELTDLHKSSAVTMTPDGKFAAVGPATGESGRAVIIDLRTGKPAGLFGPLVANVTYSGDGKVVALRDAPRMEGGPTVWKLLDVKSGAPVGLIQQSGLLRSYGESFIGLEAASRFQGTKLPDGRTAGKGVVNSWIGVWDSAGRLKNRWETGEASDAFGGLYSGMTSMEVARDVVLTADDRLALQLVGVKTIESGVFFWDATKGKPAGKLPLRIGSDIVTDMVVSQDGAKMALAVNTYSSMVGGRVETETRTTQVGPDTSVTTRSPVRVGGEVVGGGTRIDIYELQPILDKLPPGKRKAK